MFFVLCALCIANRVAVRSAALRKAYSEMNLTGIKYRPFSRLFGGVLGR